MIMVVCDKDHFKFKINLIMNQLHHESWSIISTNFNTHNHHINLLVEFVNLTHMSNCNENYLLGHTMTINES